MQKNLTNKLCQYISVLLVCLCLKKENRFYHVLTSSTMSSQWLCGVLIVVALSSCGIHGQGLDEEEQQEILNAHNYYRGLVDPLATNMLKMVRSCLFGVCTKLFSSVVYYRSGMMIWHTWLSSGPMHVIMRRMKIVTRSLPLLTTLERVLQLLPATQSTTLN